MKLTYSEQLKRPEWQKLRLEVLNDAKWHCSVCGAADKTLHVHHKQYIKGRMAWEYERSNFEALCEDCHDEAHINKSAVDSILAALPTCIWGEAVAVLAGYFSYVDEEVFEKARALDGYCTSAEIFSSLANVLGYLIRPERAEEIIKQISDAGPGDHEIIIKFSRKARTAPALILD